MKLLEIASPRRPPSASRCSDQAEPNEIQINQAMFLLYGGPMKHKKHTPVVVVANADTICKYNSSFTLCVEHVFSFVVLHSAEPLRPPTRSDTIFVVRIVIIGERRLCTH